MRLNKNGIPILDPPGVNKLPRRTACLPTEHSWGVPTRVTTEQDFVYGTLATCYKQTCKRCGEVDEYWEEDT
jgi:hypothetical protein